MTKQINHAAEFEGFRQTAQDAEWYPAIAVLTDAETNASETEAEGGGMLRPDTAEWYRAAYDSICLTSVFQEKEAVRKFFAGLGYEW
jgi:hypothetical protein